MRSLVKVIAFATGVEPAKPFGLQIGILVLNPRASPLLRFLNPVHGTHPAKAGNLLANAPPGRSNTRTESKPDRQVRQNNRPNCFVTNICSWLALVGWADCSAIDIRQSVVAGAIATTEMGPPVLIPHPEQTANLAESFELSFRKRDRERDQFPEHFPYAPTANEGAKRCRRRRLRSVWLYWRFWPCFCFGQAKPSSMIPHVQTPQWNTRQPGTKWDCQPFRVRV